MLSRHWTIKKIKDYLRVLINELAPDKIQELALDEIIFLNLSDLVEMLNGVSAPDYGIIETVLPQNGRQTVENWITILLYDYQTGIVTKNNHGLNQNDIGKTILFRGEHRGTSLLNLYLTTIVKVINNNQFAISPKPDFDITQYVIFGKNSDLYIPLSDLDYGVDRIIKIVDSINGLCIPVGDFEFQGLATNVLKQNNVYYNQFGDRIMLYKGSNVQSFGTLTVYYYRQPLRWDNDNQFIDLKDKYINLLIAKCKNSIYEFLKIAPPEALSQYIESKTQAIRQITLEEAQLVQMRQNKPANQ